jgi:hypothetical protein
MWFADDPELCRLHMPAADVHRLEEPADTLPIKALPIPKRRKRFSRQAGGVEHLLLSSTAAEATELRYELTHSPRAPPVLVIGDVGRDQALEVLSSVPVRRGGSEGRHFVHDGSVASIFTAWPNHFEASVRCGFTQKKSHSICKKRDLASRSIELADEGQRTVTRVPLFTSPRRRSCWMTGC